MAMVFTIKLTLASGNSEYLDQVFNDYSLARKTALGIRKQNKFYSLMEIEPDLWSDGDTKVQICAMNIVDAESIECRKKIFVTKNIFKSKISEI